MAEKITYYAMTPSTRNEPMGIARRREHDNGSRDEALWKDLEWHASASIVEWERGESSDDLREISEEDANRLIEHFRERWKKLQP
jgi:hypothetical protein